MRREPMSKQRGGIVGMVIFWVLLIGAGTWLIDGGFDKLMSPNAHIVSASQGEPITLRRNRSGHYEAPGQINGEPVDFLLDTGATYVAIPSHMAETLGLTPGRVAWFNTANGRVEGALTQLDEVSLGGIRIENVQGSLSPGMHDDKVLLGMSFLNLLDIEIQGGEMRLSVPDEG